MVFARCSLCLWDAICNWKKLAYHKLLLLPHSDLSIFVAVITGQPTGLVLFCSLSSVVVCNTAVRQASRPAAEHASGRAADTPQRAISVTPR